MSRAGVAARLLGRACHFANILLAGACLLALGAARAQDLTRPVLLVASLKLP
jgi:hypothetical protein